MTPRIWSLIVLLSSVVKKSRGQTIGEDICACSPSVYEFTLAFDLFCPPVNVTPGGGILRTGCLVNPAEDPNVTDRIPVAVSSIDIVELNQDLTVVVKKNIAGNFVDGDTFSYTSFAADRENINTGMDLPKAIQINLLGVNDQDEALVNSWIIQFTNNCGAFPIFFPGQSAGWVIFSELGEPRTELCPLAGETPTEMPTKSPLSPFPTQSPVVSPTQEPTTPPPVTPAPTTSAPAAPAPTTFSPVDMSMSIEINLFEDMYDIADHEFGVRTRARRRWDDDKRERLKEGTKESRVAAKKGTPKAAKNAGKVGKREKKGAKQSKKLGLRSKKDRMDSEATPITEPDSEDIAGQHPTETSEQMKDTNHQGK